MNSPQEQQQIRQQAAEWAIRLDGGDLDRSRREALDGWLAADPRHPLARRVSFTGGTRTGKH
ncbi:DUF4880 domain-containing protein, partial [Pseudomonas aeruginosa]|uniref:FecR/PupR family sigma factor regulator n=1 Tax=Pseudomonas aeruginosa TaxID=287 RepID=UPI00397E30F5